jgi:hypothetical protein
MARRIALSALLAVVLSCTPTALPRTEDSAPTAQASMRVNTADVITLREGGSAFSLVARKVANGEQVRAMGDGALLPDRTIFTVEPGPFTTALKIVDRRSAATLAARTIAGEWTLRMAGYGPGGTASPNGAFVLLSGSSFAYTDSSGAWTAKTTFALVDTALKGDPRVIELDGRYTADAVSNDGQSLYLFESPATQPFPSRLRVFDMSTRAFVDLKGDALPNPDDAFRTAPLAIGDSRIEVWAGKEPLVVRIDLGAHTVHASNLPAGQGGLGEQVLMWAAVLSRDGRTAYLVNAAIGVVDEIDPSSLAVRRTTCLASAAPTPSLLNVLIDALHPVALAKRGVGATGAILSANGSLIYTIGETGVWLIDTGTLSGRQLSKEGTYDSLALSPDGARLYALGFDDGVVRVIDTHSGVTLGAMPKIAWPSELIAVDAN